MSNNWVGWVVIISVIFADFYDIFFEPRFFIEPVMFWFWNILSLIIIILTLADKLEKLKK